MTIPTGTRLHPTGRLIPDELDDAMVAAVVESFYAQVRRDELIGPVFNRIIPADHWPQHIATITDFWSSMLLGTGRYMGRPMPKHLAIPELTDAHFARWLKLFRATAEAHCPPLVAALFTDRAQRIAYNFRMRIAQFRGGDPSTVRPQLAGEE
ncbi:MAG: group III truncated hemoglobin [Devosia sp.]